MTWLQDAHDAPTSFAGVLGLRPELLPLYQTLYAKLWDDGLVAPKLLELCRLRVAQLHGCEAELSIRHQDAGVDDMLVAALPHWVDATAFSACERAALAVAEKFVWQPRAADDEEIATLRGHLEDREIVALVFALGLFDANCRLRLAFGVGPYPVATALDLTGPLY